MPGKETCNHVRDCVDEPADKTVVLAQQWISLTDFIKWITLLESCASEPKRIIKRFPVPLADGSLDEYDTNDEKRIRGDARLLLFLSVFLNLFLF